MSTLTQYQASRATRAELRKSVECLPVGTPVTLTFLRSYLNRPRYLGGRLTHDFEAKLIDPHPGSEKPFRVTDSDLKNLVISRTLPAPTRA